MDAALTTVLGSGSRLVIVTRDGQLPFCTAGVRDENVAWSVLEELVSRGRSDSSRRMIAQVFWIVAVTTEVDDSGDGKEKGVFYFQARHSTADANDDDRGGVYKLCMVMSAVPHWIHYLRPHLLHIDIAADDDDASAVASIVAAGSAYPCTISMRGRRQVPEADMTSSSITTNDHCRVVAGICVESDHEKQCMLAKMGPKLPIHVLDRIGSASTMISVPTGGARGQYVTVLMTDADQHAMYRELCVHMPHVQFRVANISRTDTNAELAMDDALVQQTRLLLVLSGNPGGGVAAVYDNTTNEDVALYMTRAMALGIPIVVGSSLSIAGSLPRVARMVQNGKNGFVLSDSGGRIESWMDKIHLLFTDADMYDALSAGARDMYATHYSLAPRCVDIAKTMSEIVAHARQLLPVVFVHPAVPTTATTTTDNLLPTSALEEIMRHHGVTNIEHHTWNPDGDDTMILSPSVLERVVIVVINSENASISLFGLPCEKRLRVWQDFLDSLLTEHARVFMYFTAATSTPTTIIGKALPPAATVWALHHAAIAGIVCESAEHGAFFHAHGFDNCCIATPTIRSNE